MSIQSFLLFYTFASCAAFVFFFLGLKGENDRLQSLLKTALAHHQETIVQNARLKYEAKLQAVRLVENVNANRFMTHGALAIYEEIWGNPPMQRNLSDVLNWIREARDVANYHAEYSARLREHYAELEEKYNAMGMGPKLRQKMLIYLDSITITGESIGRIRSSLFIPFECEWNAFVRDETASRENRGKPSTVIEAAFSA